ncbi:MAG: hypothetical protein HOV82_16850 [Streptomyces sp.]|nr:hypothetical protein [Streptomyces sp.]NUP36156.1 hypothetical protein [Streptomyces sp.]NUS75503.1 hypothetical protein [Streptomyces sp.]
MTTALTLFDLTDLTPVETTVCGWCGTRPATTRVYATRNLLGVHPVWLAPTWYRDATHRAHSGPCCDTCAWNLACSWWNAPMSCPHGTCCLWAHTLADPLPEWDCTRHHSERTVVWRDQLEVAA